MYSNIGNRYRLEWASTILAVIAIFVCSPIFYFYRNGEKIRLKSKFAAQIEKARREGRGGDISGDRKGSEGAGAEKKEDRGWSRSASMAGISRYPEPGQKRGSKARAGGAKAAKPTVAHDEV